MFPHYGDCIPSSCQCLARVLHALRSFDCETYLIAPGNLTPPLVCGSAAASGGGGLVLSRAACFDTLKALCRSSAIVAGANIAYDFAVMAREEPELLDLIFGMYIDRRVWDVQIAEALAAIARGELGIDPRTHKMILNDDGKATGRYSLNYCTSIRLGRSDAKRFAFWRLRFGLLAGLEVAEYPEDAKSYMVDDACNTVEVAAAQVTAYFRGVDRNLGNLAEQAEVAFDLHLWSCHGLRTNRARVETLGAKVDAIHEKVLTRYQALGFIRPDGSEDKAAIKRAVALAYGAGGVCPACAGGGKVPSAKTGNPVQCKDCDASGFDLATAPGLPRADKGGISTSRDTKSESGDDDLEDYAENETERIRTTYMPALRLGLEVPICPRPNVLLETGRISYDGLVQLMPRKGGVRECFEARKGYVFFDVDYAAIQLCTLAQVCLWVCGRSNMADTINQSGDPGMLHTALGAKFIGMDLAEFVRRYDLKDEQCNDARQGAKPINFGFIGMMGAATLVSSKRKRSEGTTTGPDGKVYAGIRFCILLDGAERCGVEKITEWKGRATVPICKRCVSLVESRLKPMWFEQWPEVKQYHNWVKRQVDLYGEIASFSPPNGPRVDRVRGNVTPSQAAFNGVQGLEADGFKDAIRAITRECYLDRRSVLYGTRPILAGHDAVFGETREDTAHEAAHRISDIMVERMQLYTPDVRVKASPALMRFWSKEAKPKYNKAGRLIPWDDAACA